MHAHSNSASPVRKLRPERSADAADAVPTCLCVVCGEKNPLRASSLLEVIDPSSGLSAAAGAPVAAPVCVFCSCNCSGDGHGARTPRGQTSRPQLVIRSDRVHLRDLTIASGSDQKAQSSDPLARAASLSRRRKYVAVRVREAGAGEGHFASTFVCACLDESGHGQPQRVRQLALKRVNRRYARDSELVRETGALAWLSRQRHYGTPTLWDVVTWHGRFCLIMDYYDAPSVTSQLKSGRRFAADEVASFLEQMALILHDAHKSRVLHRDIHPENVLVLDRKSLRPPRFVLTGFGVAAAAELDLDEESDVPKRARPSAGDASGVAAGHSAYIPIEQLRGRPVRASDLFAAGKVACEMLLGLGSRAMANEARLAKSLADPTPGDAELAAIPPPLRRVLTRLLQGDYEDRYQSAAELWQALRGEGLIPQELLSPEAARDRSLQVMDFVRGTEDWDVLAQIRELRHELQSSAGPPSPAAGLRPSAARARAAFKAEASASFRVASEPSVFDPHGCCEGIRLRLKRASSALTDEQSKLTPKQLRGGSVWLDVELSAAARDALERGLANHDALTLAVADGAGGGKGEPRFSLSRSLADVGVLEVLTRPNTRPIKLPVAEGVRCPYVWGAGPFRLAPPAELPVQSAAGAGAAAADPAPGAPAEKLAATAAGRAPSAPPVLLHARAASVGKPADTASPSYRCVGLDFDGLVHRFASLLQLRWGDGPQPAVARAAAAASASSSASGPASTYAALEMSAAAIVSKLRGEEQQGPLSPSDGREPGLNPQLQLPARDAASSTEQTLRHIAHCCPGRH